MKSLGSFIIKPEESRYDNQIKVGDKSLITNTKVEDHRSVSKRAIIVSIPLSIKTDMKPGDSVIVHHNVFRRFYDVRGVEKNSGSYFKEDMYFCDAAQIYMYKKENNWHTNLEYCFVSPIEETSNFSLEKEQKHIGILKYGNKSLEALKIAPGDLVGFTKNSEFEFVVDGKRMYCMKSNDIVIKYEHKGNEKEYNPSWAESR
jgi:hypothetical protein